jgi:Skp family chaperone for outer membrane proteins
MPCGASLEIGWIPVRASVDRDQGVHASDHIDVAVRLLPILEHEHQDALLRDELARRGWTRNEDGSMSKVFGDAVATLPANSSTIRLEVSENTRVAVTGTAEKRTAEETKAAAQDEVARKAEAAAATKLADAVADARAAMIARNIQRLERVAEDLRAEVAEVATATTRRSLETRAAALGSVESVTEGRAADGSYELAITVRT